MPMGGAVFQTWQRRCTAQAGLSWWHRVCCKDRQEEARQGTARSQYRQGEMCSRRGDAQIGQGMILLEFGFQVVCLVSLLCVLSWEINLLLLYGEPPSNPDN